MSLYVMRSVSETSAAWSIETNPLSTILSQVTMIFGGSLFPGALGAMLIEILPFLRGIGSDIQGALADESPAIVPTVMVAYTLTSFMIGIVFVALGIFRAGVIVSLRE